MIEASRKQNAPRSSKFKCSHLQLEKIPFLTLSMERLHVPEWEILFPHGVICWSISTLSVLPSLASKSFLCVLALSILP